MVRYSAEGYYDPNADQFISIDPAVSVTGQPYTFTGDNPLNATDPLGRLRSGGSGQLCGGGPHPLCNTGNQGGPVTVPQTPPSYDGVPATKTSTPYAGVPFVVTTKPVIIPGPIASVKVSASASIIGPDASAYLALEEDGTVDLAIGGSTASVSPDGAMSGTVGIPGTGLSVSKYGVSATSTRTSDVGPDQVTTSVTATLEPSDGLPPGEAAAGAGAIGGGTALWWAAKGLSPLCTFAGGPFGVAACAAAF